MPTPSQFAKILDEALRESPEREQQRIVRDFVALLQRKRLLGMGSRILRAFEERRKKETLSGEAAHMLPMARFHTVVQNNLIAGARLRKGERVADATVKGRLSQLKRILEHSQ